MSPREEARFDRLMDKFHAHYERLLAAAEARATRAEARVAGAVEALTPSGDTKATYIGEFFEEIEVPNPEWGPDEDPEGEDSDNGEYRRVRVPVSWTTIKEIMAAIRSRFDAPDHIGHLPATYPPPRTQP